MRGDGLTGEELTAYEQKQESLNLTGLKSERRILDKALGKTSEEGGSEEGKDGDQTKTGRSTTDKDNSKDESGETVRMPSWFSIADADGKNKGAQS